jgi:hypothetical protein
MTVKCTTHGCDQDATRVFAWSMRIPAVFVAPYCDKHAADVETHHNGLPAAGPAISSDCESIAGIRRKRATA